MPGEAEKQSQQGLNQMRTENNYCALKNIIVLRNLSCAIKNMLFFHYTFTKYVSSNSTID